MSISVAAGRLKHPLWLQEPTLSRDSFGDSTESWKDNRKLWCEIQPVSAKEKVTGEQIAQHITHIIRFRHQPGLRITPSMRLVKKGRGCDNDRVFNIEQPINAQERDILMEVTAIEDFNASS